MSYRRMLVLGAGAFLLGLAWSLAAPSRAHAEGLQIRPLLYRQQLKAGEPQRGFVDVSNASHSPVNVVLKVQSFKQIDGRGTLEFFDSATMKAAVQLDLQEIDLGPSEAVRVYFLLDPSKLPAGDNFGAIFAATRVETDGGAAPSAQVGTLLLIENGAGGPHHAKVAKLSAPLINFQNTMKVTADVYNTGESGQSSAYFPELDVSVGPWFGSSQKVQAPLVFSGITRTVPLDAATNNKFGLYRLTVAADSGASNRWVFLITGVWRLILPVLAVLAAGLYAWTRRYKLELQWVSSQRPQKTVGSAAGQLSDKAKAKSETGTIESKK